MADSARACSRARGFAPSISIVSDQKCAQDGLRPAGVGVGRHVEVLALFRELLDEPPQLGGPALGRGDRQAFLAARITARLARIKPVLHGAGQQAVGDVPQVGLLVVVGDLVAEVDGLGEGFVEGMLLRSSCGSLAGGVTGSSTDG